MAPCLLFQTVNNVKAMDEYAWSKASRARDGVFTYFKEGVFSLSQHTINTKREPAGLMPVS